MRDHAMGNLLAVPFLLFFFSPFILFAAVMARRVWEILKGK